MRRNWQDGVEIVLEDLNAISKALERGLYDRLFYELVDRQEDAFFGDGFYVSFAGATSIIVKKGTGFQTDSSQTTPEPEKRLLFLSADENKSLGSPDGSNDRIDIVVVKSALIDELTDTRKYKDAGSGVITDENVVTQKDWEAEIEIVAGTPAGSPSAPSTPTGYIKIAECYVNAVSGMVNQDDITDSRTQLPVASLTTINTSGYERLTAGASTTLNTLFADVDALLKNGDYEYYDLEEMDAAPSNPDADKRRLYFLEDNILYSRDSSGNITRVNADHIQLSQTINNNESTPQNVVGLSFDKTDIKGVQVSFDIHRETDSSNVQESGILFITHDSKDDVWRISKISGLDNSGVTFSITSGGQVQYISNDLTGTNYDSSLKCSNIHRFDQ